MYRLCDIGFRIGPENPEWVQCAPGSEEWF
jgi:hypothetical protein